VLFNPVTHVMTSFAQWSRYTVPQQVFVADRSAGLGQATARTANTTVHVGLGTPHWYMDTASNVSEFVASLEGLHGRWMEQLTEYHIDLNAQRLLLDETMSSTRPKAAVLRAQADLLRDRRLRFQTFVTDCLSTIALIKSPSLVRSPVVAENLAVLDAAGGGQRREEEFKRRSDEVLSDDLQGVIDEAALRLESAEAAQRRGWMDTLLAVIAAVGVSGLAQLLQAGYGFHGLTSLEFTVGIVVLAVLVGVYAARSAVRTGGSMSKARGGAKDRSTGAAAAAPSTPRDVPRQVGPRHDRVPQR
jgi:hypothetical protein